MELTAYTVTLSTPQGEGKLDLKAFSEEAASRRAWMAALHQGWGDVDDIEVTSIELCTDWPEEGF